MTGIKAHTGTRGWSKKRAHFFVSLNFIRLNFIKY